VACEATVLNADMPNATEMKKWQTMLGKGHAFVVGLPKDFNLTEVLREATNIKLATAFAQLGGWHHFRDGAKGGHASVSLLTGKWFFQTQPALLWEWHNFALADNRVKAKLATAATHFHPKVLIVESNGRHPDFAIVGSGNLSQGGLHTNTECSLYIENAGFIEELTAWFEWQFTSAAKLTPKVIERYALSYKENHSRVKAVEKEEQRVTKDLASVDKATIAQWKALVKKATEYLKSSRYERDYECRKDGAKKILEVLNYQDKFTFDRNGWNAFYAIRELGKLRGHRDQVFKKHNRVQDALRKLKADGEDALPAVLDRGGKFYVPGFGVATVSKILASHDPKTWPVYNNRVAAVLDDFGYKAERGAGPAGRYTAFKKAMADFMVECKAKDALALDAFFLDAWKETKQYKKAA
jgi:HKD family nuclease